MTRYLLCILLGLFGVLPLQAGSPAFVASPGSSADPSGVRPETGSGREIWLGDPRFGSSLAEVVGALGPGRATLRIPRGLHALPADLTIPKNLDLRPESGALFKIASGKTLTINGTFSAGLMPVFDPAAGGLVKFGPGAVAQVRPEWWGARGDGRTDNTAALQAALDAGRGLQLAPGGIYVTGNICNAASEVIIDGGGATLQTIATGGRSLYSRGCILALVHCRHVRVQNLIFDGNRRQLAGSGMNHGIFIAPAWSAAQAEVIGNNYGEDKPCRNISIENCLFKGAGTPRQGQADKFGDGVYACAVDGLSITDCSFEDMGRWAFAASDVFNVRFTGNRVYHDPENSVALGAIDIENESLDKTNGSYSRNIYITDNILRGRAAICLNALASPGNAAGRYHYLRNVKCLNNFIESYYYNRSGLGICAISLAAYGDGTGVYPEMRNIEIRGNQLQSLSATPVTYGLSYYFQHDNITCADIRIAENSFRGYANGIVATHTVSPRLGGLYILHNQVVAGHDASGGIGIKTRAARYGWLDVSFNYVADYGTGIQSYEDTGGTRGQFVGNGVECGLAKASAGRGFQANYPEVVLMGNSVHGAFGQPPLTGRKIANIGNSWNHPGASDSHP